MDKLVNLESDSNYQELMMNPEADDPTIVHAESSIDCTNLGQSENGFTLDAVDTENNPLSSMVKREEGKLAAADKNVNTPPATFLQPIKQVFGEHVALQNHVNMYNLRYFWLNEQELAACDEDILSITETVYVEEMEWDLYCGEDKVEDARQFWNGIRTLFAKIGEYVKVLTLRLVDSSYLPAEVEDIKTGLICRGIFESCPNLTALKLCGTWTTGYHDDVSEEEDRGPLSLMNLDVLVVHRKADGLSLVKALENVVDNVRHLSIFDDVFTRFMRNCQPLPRLEKLTLRCIGTGNLDHHANLPLFTKCPSLRFLDLQTAGCHEISEYSQFINTIISSTKLEELTTDDSVTGLKSEQNYSNNRTRTDRIQGLRRAIFKLSSFDPKKASMMELHADVRNVKIVACSPRMTCSELRNAVLDHGFDWNNIEFE